MTTHWIANQTGNRHALVADDDALATWALLYGWHETTEPAPHDQTYVMNPDGLTGCVPYSALAAGWAEAGWVPGPPPIPTDPTRPPPVEEPPPPPPADSPSASKTRAASGQSKES